MTNAFDWLLSATKSSTGFPADDDRLVQQWFWYRVATAETDGLGHASNLADRGATGADGQWILTSVGEEWQTFVRDIPPTINLRAMDVPTSTGRLLPGGGASVSLVASAVNNGNIALTETVTIDFYADPELATLLGSASIEGVPGCARREVTIALDATWPGAGEGSHNYWFELDGPHQLAESDEEDNVGEGVVRVLGWALYVPLVVR
jgi:hypothetical protein